MLEFAAREYMEVTHKFGIVLALVRREQYDENALGDSLTQLHNVSRRLDLPVTTELFACLVREMVQSNPDSVRRTGKDVEIEDAHLSSERLCYHLESIYCALKAEIGSIQLRAIPREKAKYSMPDWLEGTKVAAKYPETVDEFYHAGRCFSYGENTACVFHLMRVTEFCFTEVGNSLGVPFDPINWNQIAQHITKEMEKKYQTKTADWKAREPFYANILTDIQAIGRGHRNSALHDLEKKYDEGEARYMLTVIETFANHVAGKL